MNPLYSSLTEFVNPRLGNCSLAKSSKKPFKEELLFFKSLAYTLKMVLYSTKSGSLARNHMGTTFGAV